MARRADASKDLLPGTLDMLILKIIKQAPLHGYRIAQEIERRSGDLLQVEEGSLYPALQRLLKAKWVTAEWGVSDTNRHVRNYRLTPAGRKRLEAEVVDFDRLIEGIARVMRTSEA